MSETSSLVQTFLRMLLTRPGPGLIILIGIAALTAIVVSLLAMADAFERALTSTGQPDRALVLRAGSTSEINGNVALPQFSVLQEMPEVRHASRETYVTVRLPTRTPDGEATIPLRGVEEAAFAVRPEVTITAGQPFHAGKYELIAGVKAVETFSGLAIGETIRIRGQDYRITGHFTAGGTATETELWMDERLLAQTLGRGETFSSVLVGLTSADAFEPFSKRLSTDRRLTLGAYRESDYYRELAAPTTGLINGLGLLVGVIMALGAIAASINAMQTALEARTREVATFRALGFRRLPVLCAVLIECTVIAVLGASLAVLGVYTLLDGTTMSTVAGASTSGAQVAFEFQVTRQTLATAIALALGLGLVGGLMPGIGAVRRSIPDGLKG